MTALTRYALIDIGDMGSDKQLCPRPTGEWVKFTEAERDKAEAVRELVEALKAAKPIVQLAWARNPQLEALGVALTLVGNALAARGAE